MSRILVTEQLAAAGLTFLRDAGHEVDERLGMSREELLTAVKGAHALIVRSNTRVTAEVVDAGADLVVVGRAGVGVDNVDLDAATKRGVMVVNAPQSTILSNAEHTIALLLAQARSIPQAHAALAAGRWARRPFEGIELSGKTLGIAGFGRIGPLIAQRAHAFGMRVIAWDPLIARDRAQRVGVELVDEHELMAQSDFLSIALPKNPGTIGKFDEALLAEAKPGLRIVNTARGGIVDEAALARAIKEGRIAGAAFDTFEAEPGEGGELNSPLLGLDNVIVTPHLGASTREAQDKAGVTIAEQVQLALTGEFVPYAVNVQASEASETVRPFLPLAERLGAIFAGLLDAVSGALEITYEGAIADYDTQILKLAILKGLLQSRSADPVSFVNAPQLASERGLEIRETTSATPHDYVNLVSIRGGDHSLAGTLAGVRGEPRLVMIDDHAVDMPPASHMLVVRNDDRPGVIGRVGTALGDRGVNISDMDVGRTTAATTALMVLALDEPAPLDIIDELRRQDGILAVDAINLV